PASSSSRSPTSRRQAPGRPPRLWGTPGVRSGRQRGPRPAIAGRPAVECKRHDPTSASAEGGRAASPRDLSGTWGEDGQIGRVALRRAAPEDLISMFATIVLEPGGVIAWLVVGLIAGFLASRVMGAGG